jgi:hypothetical protein
MPLKYWDEAFLAATYLINCLPTKVLNFSSPLETLFQEKPSYTGLRIFGCSCWPNLRPFNTHKGQFRSKQCVFLGYSNLHKGFKWGLDVSSGRIYISHDVVFNETFYPFSKFNPNAGAHLRSEILLLPLQIQPPTTLGQGDKSIDNFNSDVHVITASTNGSGSSEHATNTFVEFGAGDRLEFILQQEVHVQVSSTREPTLGTDLRADSI